MKSFIPGFLLTVTLACCLAGPVGAAEGTAAPDPAANGAPAASPDAQAAPTVSVAAFLDQLDPALPGTDGAQIGAPVPILMTCPGIVYCRNFCLEEGGSSCVATYKCFANGTWSCTCTGPGGGPCL